VKTLVGIDEKHRRIIDYLREKHYGCPRTAVVYKALDYWLELAIKHMRDDLTITDEQVTMLIDILHEHPPRRKKKLLPPGPAAKVISLEERRRRP